MRTTWYDTVRTIEELFTKQFGESTHDYYGEEQWVTLPPQARDEWEASYDESCASYNPSVDFDAVLDIMFESIDLEYLGLDEVWDTENIVELRAFFK